ncbi:hypothetical protein NKG94_35145 [Micromonospora sp. M12]
MTADTLAFGGVGIAGTTLPVTTAYERVSAALDEHPRRYAGSSTGCWPRAPRRPGVRGHTAGTHRPGGGPNGLDVAAGRPERVHHLRRLRHGPGDPRQLRHPAARRSLSQPPATPHARLRPGRAHPATPPVPSVAEPSVTVQLPMVPKVVTVRADEPGEVVGWTRW